MSELTMEVKEAVVHSVRNWPKTIDSERLLRELSELASRVYVLATTAENEIGRLRLLAIFTRYDIGSFEELEARLAKFEVLDQREKD